ncbi:MULTISPECIES: lasso peptide biosynthesis protein [unclassified Bacillus (in: firmicutes)]|uniref:lasso peptide biosynthesis protein n=1 Tax=unclassified Bacillus (in: firmicutes) TaxID=185979 RepID=UPI001BEC2A93|nr:MULTISPECIES: lasso peptide biosynthesis protein [unclassified Bacillus (in: firmicutes)]MBT2616127.1 lasso peptide biosynthesis protein [Bacillus sp. ISL-78]MBT2628423.1 lasso peptide biosynthesis protein [Bacillus sp. ISL-101]
MVITMKDRLKTKSFGHVVTKVKMEVNGMELTDKKDNEIKNTYNTILDFFANKPMQGGCHFFSAAMYILLQEQDIICKLMIGEVKDDSFPTSFSHSWVEIDEQVYDIAIMFPHHLEGQPPVFAGIDLDNKKKSTRKYGINDKLRIDDKVALNAYKLSVSDYLDGPPQGKDYLWKDIFKMGKRILKGKTIEELRKLYKDEKRVLKLLN